MVYVVSDDPRKVGQVGLHGPDEMYVEFISPEQGRLLEVENRP